MVNSCGDSSLPHSTFLRFPKDQRNRIIALPAFLGGEFNTAGVKWISSFPGNDRRRIDRATAVIVLNSVDTGLPIALLEGAVISAKRTAASAALAARYLYRNVDFDSVGLIGCGLINFEVARFLLIIYPWLKKLIVYDKHQARAQQFAEKCKELSGGLNVVIVGGIDEVLSSSTLVSIATTAGAPHINNISRCRPGAVILHISLRDLAPEIILNVDNVVDDIDHVCREETSIHLAERLAGNREFINRTMAEVISGNPVTAREVRAVTVFSPFGLGVLDIAVSRLVYDMAQSQNRGAVIESFFPLPWTRRPGGE